MCRDEDTLLVICMTSKIYVNIITVGGISIYDVDENPNGVLFASQGSIAVRSDEAITYQNTDGAGSWRIIGAASPLPTPRILVRQGIQGSSEGKGPPDGGGPFPVQVAVTGVTQDMVNNGARLWLMRYAKNRNRTQGGEQYKSSGFVHPSDINPMFSNWGGGDHSFFNGSGTVRSIQTEWELDVGNQFIDVTIDPNDWYRGPISFPVDRTTWNENNQYGMYAQSGSTYTGSRKTAVFSFRVAIEDPENSGRPLFGPMSGNFLLSPRLQGSNYIQWQVRTKQT